MPSDKPTDVTTQLQFAATDLEVDSTFTGYNPPLQGTLTTVLGTSLAASVATSPRGSTLTPILAASSVKDPNVLLALSTTLPGSGVLQPITVGVSATTTGAGFAGVLKPLLPSLLSTDLGADLNELLPLISLVAPGLSGTGVPTTGVSTHAASDVWISGNVGAGVGLAGAPALGASFTFGNPNALAQFANATANFVNNTAKLATDVSTGAVFPAIRDATAVVGSVTALTAAATGLALTSHPGSPAPHLALGSASVVDLGVDLGGGISLRAPVLGALKVGAQVHIGIQADQAGAYALGQVLEGAAPGLVAGIGTGGSTTPSILGVVSDLAGSLSKLLVDTAGSVGAHGTTTATTTPSSVDKPDVIIDIGLNLSETLGFVPVTNQQALHIDLALNASGTVKFAGDLVPLINDLAPFLLKTSLGSELIGAVSTTFDQIVSQLGLPPAHPAAAGAITSNNTAHPALLAHLG